MKVKILCENEPSAPEFEAEHGLSFYVETSSRRFLFDFGATSVFLRNAERLGVDVSAVDAAFLSHGHRDHGGGLATFLEKNAKASVYASEKALQSYYSLRPSGEYADIGVRVAPENDVRIIRTPTNGTFALDSETILFSDAAPDPPEFRSEGNATLFERFERPVDRSVLSPAKGETTLARLEEIKKKTRTRKEEKISQINETRETEQRKEIKGIEKTNEIGGAKKTREMKKNRRMEETRVIEKAGKEKGIKAIGEAGGVEQGKRRRGAIADETRGAASTLPGRMPQTTFEFRPDRFLHEQHLIATTENGLKILFVGCAHRGIVSAMTRATSILGAAPDVAIGGFHLSIPSRGIPAPERTLDAIAERLRAWPTRYFTGHCSGRAAFERVRRTLGAQISYFSAGDCFDF